MSAFHFFLSVVVAAIALFSATAAEHQTPAVGSGKFDKKGWPKPRWWKKYRLRFGKLKQSYLLDH
jgi:predicted transcriptional regulator